MAYRALYTRRDGWKQGGHSGRTEIFGTFVCAASFRGRFALPLYNVAVVARRYTYANTEILVTLQPTVLVTVYVESYPGAPQSGSGLLGPV